MVCEAGAMRRARSHLRDDRQAAPERLQTRDYRRRDRPTTRTTRRSAAWRSTSIVVLALVAAACANGIDSASDPAASSAPTVSTEVEEPTTAPNDAGSDAPTTSDDPPPAATETPITVDDPPPPDAAGASAALPVRDGQRERTTESVPHVQLDAVPVAEADAALRRRAFAIPGVEDIPSGISLPGARGLSIRDDVELARPDVLLSGREFAHIHPDGSLHIWMPVELAIEVEQAGWGELHPWVDRDGFWDGVVMVFTPRSLDEVDVMIRLLVEAYNFVTGASLDPTDIP